VRTAAGRSRSGDRPDRRAARPDRRHRPADKPYAILAYFTGGRLQRWLAAKPSRIATITAVAFIVAGAVTFLYWDVRLLARREIIPWYPTAPWA
jgi:hypothetical protein